MRGMSWRWGAWVLLAIPAMAGVTRVVNDFDHDGRTDAGWYDADPGVWTIRYSGGGVWNTNNVQKFNFGFAGTLALPGDFDGDGTADLCVIDPAWSRWYLRPSTAPETNFVLGTTGDLPVTGDFDGDQRTDFGVFDPVHGSWTLRMATGGVRTVSLGTPGRVPVVADFDHDGRDDIGTYFAADGSWHLLRSTAGLQQKSHGFPGTYPVVGDFDGDGFADIGVVDQPVETGGRGRPRPYLLQTTRGATNGILHGLSYQAGWFGIGDYDANGRFEFLTDEQMDYGAFSKIENLNDPTFTDLAYVTNRYPGVPLSGAPPTLDVTHGWRNPADAAYGLPLTAYFATFKLVNGRTITLNPGSGQTSTISLRDWNGATAPAYLGLLGEKPHFHLASPGTMASGPFTLLAQRTSSVAVPLIRFDRYSSLSVIVEQFSGLYRDRTTTQNVTMTRYQFVLFLGGVL